MCILCVIQKWSRRVATMLPWLVIPLIGLWALSQLLPPPFRFEITSPRLACVFVLLITLFWYEILMPQLSAWRVRRNARLRERKRFEAIELQKLRKTATRRCRNCLTPYRDQNPGGGRFMCSYCGHISKRPVLDLPVPPGMAISNSGIIKDIMGKGGKILNGKGWSENAWMCGQDWLENGNWVAGKSTYWRRNGSGVFGGDENCLAEKSYSGVAIFACKLLTSFFLSMRWLWRKIFRVSSSRHDPSSDSDSVILAKRGENGPNYHESRVEKARRKAEEKRQARLEKELLEEEERKQREEVARLVEERRRLRDEKREDEKDRKKSSPPARQKEGKKEVEKKRQEKRKEKDKASSKSNSDAEEVEKQAGKETEQKCEFDKKNDMDRREYQKPGSDVVKRHKTETSHGQGAKNISATVLSRGNAGTRYFDRMKGTFLSSSRAFSGSSFFGKSVDTYVTTAKENRTNSSLDHVHTSSHRRDFCPPDRVIGRSSLNGDDKRTNTNSPVFSEPQSRLVPKKSWHQLFARSSSVPQSLSRNVIGRPNTKLPTEGQNMELPGHSSPLQTFDNPINFGLPSPFIGTYPNSIAGTSLGFSRTMEPIFPPAGEVPPLIPEEHELFEDPCYVPDPVSLLGPVSESLDSFQLDIGAGYITDIGLEKPSGLKNLSASSEVIRPSPIESPLSRLRVDEEKNNIYRFPGTPTAQDVNMDDANANEKGTWQMWNGPSLGHDGLVSVGGPTTLFLPPEQYRLNKEDLLHPSPQKCMVSLFTKEDPILSGTHSPQKVAFGNGQNAGVFSPVTCPSNQDLWLQNAFFTSLSGSDGCPLKPLEETSETVYGSPSESANSHSFEPSHANYLPKKEWGSQSSGEGGKASGAISHIGGLFSNSDVQSLWSFD